MLQKELTPKSWPGCHVTFGPLSGPRMWDLSRSGMGGDAVYAAFVSCVTNWRNAPLMGGGKSETYDPAPDVVNNLMPGFVIEIVTEAMTLSTLSETERKNSSSQLTSDSMGSSTAENVAVKTD